MSENLGPAVSPVARTAELQAQRTAETGPMFARAFAEAPPVDVTPVLAEIGQRLRTARGPERAALQNAVAMLAETGPNGARTWATDAETIHNVKTALDRLVQYGDPGLGIAPGALSQQQGALKSVRGALNDRLRAQVPGYGAANDASAGYAREIEAIETGAGVLDGGKGALWPADLDRRLAAMTPNERAGLFVGVRGSIENRIGTGADDLAGLRQSLGADQGWNRQKMASVFGEEPTQAVAGAVDREGRFAQTFADVAGRADAGARQAASKAVGQGGVPDVPAGLTVVGGAGRALQGAGRVALRAITGARSDAIRDELGDVLSRQGDARDAVVRAILDAAATRAARADQIRGAVGSSAAAAGTDQLLSGPVPYGFAGR